MTRTFVKSKIHRATVTDGSLNYMGSITIDAELMDAAGLKHYELVHINNLSNAAHWETYCIPGTKGQIVLNGPPARLFQPGDKIVILNMVHLSEGEETLHRTVFVDSTNQITSIEENNIIG